MRVVAFLPVVLAASCRGSGHDAPAPDSMASSLAAPILKEAPAASASIDASPGISLDASARGSLDASSASAWPQSAHVVLHVGDSTVGYTLGLALELGKRFKDVGVRYEAHTATAAGLHTFAKSKKTAELVKEKKPDVVLLTLGTNNLSVPHPEVYEEDVRAIVKQVGPVPCYWIGPINIVEAVKKEKAPGGPRDPRAAGEAVVAMLQRSSSPCRFYDSHGLDIQRQTDEVHPTQVGAGRWADRIWEFLNPSRPLLTPGSSK